MSHGPDMDPCAVFDPRRHVARKARRCDVCRETIEVGFRYTRLSACFDGRWSHSSHCARCWAIFDALTRHTQDPVSPMLDCGESWLDTFGEVEPPEVAALAFTLPSEFV